MTKLHKLFIALAVGVISIPIIILFYIQIALSPTCENKIIKTSENSSNEYSAILFERSCGATTGFSTQVSILQVGQELPNESGNVYIADGYPNYNSLTWLSDNILHIGGADTNAYKRVDSYMGVNIKYE